MKIRLDLSRHCIETASKKKYEQMIIQYFKTPGGDGEKSATEHHISALKYFLEKADFSKLRALCSKIDSNREAVLIVPQNFEGMHICINQTILYPKWKSV